MSHPLGETIFSWNCTHFKENYFVQFVKHENNSLNGCLALVGQQKKKLDVVSFLVINITTL